MIRRLGAAGHNTIVNIAWQQFLQRHGESGTNVMQIFTCRRLDPGLTETGRRQMEAVAGYYRSRAVRRIVTSPSRRAVGSAKILGSRLGITHQVHECLREVDVGDLEGQSERDPRRLGEFFSVIADWLIQGKNTRFPGGESFEEVKQRLRVLDSLMFAGPAIFVGHTALFAVFLGVRGKAFRKVEELFLPRAGIARYCVSEKDWILETNAEPSDGGDPQGRAPGHDGR